VAERTVPAGETAGGTAGGTATHPAGDLTVVAPSHLSAPSLPDPRKAATVTEFAAALTRLRERAGIDARDLARAAGVAPDVLDDWLSGRRTPSAASTGAVESLLAACGVPRGEAQAAWLETASRVRRLHPGTADGARGPYRGLASHGIADAPLFVGRERLVARLVAAVTSAATTGAVTVLVGPSGSGKTSALHAGLLARLQGGGSWDAVTLTPGTSPASALEGALEEIRTRRLQPGSRAVLVVDQFEELFTLCRSAAERREFVQRLTGPLTAAVARSNGPGPTLCVVVALRAEFYGAALAFDTLAPALQDHQVVVGPMSEQDLRRAATDPARLSGGQLEPGLAELVLRDVASDAALYGDGPTRVDALPLMSYALLQAWRRSPGGRLTVEDYVTARGVGGAVQTAAETVWETLTPDVREAARRLFVRLVAVGADGVDARRRLDATEPGPDGRDPDGAEAVERFADAGLLTVTPSAVEIAHDAVLRAWPRLRGWLDDERAGLVVGRRLAVAAATWEREGRPASLLWRGPDLAAAHAWADDGSDHGERGDFLAASEAARRRGAARERRRLRRLQVVGAGAAAAALVASSLAVTATVQRSGTADDRDRAVSRRLAEAAVRLRRTDPTVAAQAALLAWRTAPTAQARAALLDTSALPLATRVAAPAGTSAVAASGDGRTLAAVGDQGDLRVWRVDAAPGTTPDGTASDAVPAPADVADVRVDARGLAAVVLTADGGLLLAAGTTGTVHAWDLSSGHPEPLPAVTPGHGPVTALALSPDGRTLAVPTGDGHVMLYAVTGTRLTAHGQFALPGPAAAVTAVAFAADGRTLATGTATGRVQLWSLADRARPVAGATLTGPAAAVTSLAFTADGRRLAATSKDQRAYVWQPAAPTAAPQRLADAAGPLAAVAPSPDGAWLAVAGGDHHVRVYETATGAAGADLPHPGAVTGVAYLSGGRVLVTACADGLLRLWPAPAPTSGVPGGRIAALAYLDGHRLAAATGHDAVRVVDVTQPHRPRPLGGTVGATGPSPGPTGAASAGTTAGTAGTARATLTGALAVAPGGSVIAAGGTGGAVILYDTTTGGAPRRLAAVPTSQAGTTGPGGTVRSLAFSPDGRLLAAGADDGTVRLADVSTPAAPRPLGTPERAGGGPATLAFSPDGHRIAVGTPDRVQLWDVGADRLTRAATSPEGPARPVRSIAFAPDGRTVAVGSADGTLRLLDVSGAVPSWTGAPLASGDDVTGVAFDRTGGLVAATGADGAVRLWDVGERAAPTLTASLTAASDTLAAVALDPATGRVAAAGAAPSIWQWDLDPRAAADRVCRLAGAAVPAAEWERLLPDAAYRDPCP